MLLTLKQRLPYIAALMVLISAAAIVIGQTPSPDPKAVLLQQIRDDASRHVQAGAPMQTELIINLYSHNNTVLTPREIAQAYESEYIKQKKLAEPGVWDQLRPKLAWIVIVILALALIFYKVLEKWLTTLIELVGGRVWNKLAGNRLFKSVALQRYQKALSESYSELTIPFSNRRLKMREVYVPLKVVGSSTAEQLDAIQAITRDRRLMIVGPPGSGKSMLLKNLAFNYAQGQFMSLPDQPIPILLELHYLSEKPDLTMTQHLALALGRNRFSHADRFVSQNLTNGTLILLLDGLDEVNSSERTRVVGKIRDFLFEHRDCRVVITCRNAVYKGEFAESVDRTLEIVEFSDQQVRSFLASWEPHMPDGRSVEQLMQTLRDRPRIMALARNPLLLTLIAYLYTDTPYVLPHSRAEFYRQSTDFLLRQWHQERNAYESRDKQAILQRLALYFMDSTGEREQDRLSLDFQTVLEQVKLLLPKLNLRQDQDVRPLLNEIVERSGLLLSIDGGQRYQFAHLTLQEYFAAEEMLDDTSGLIGRFLKDRDSWRETVKLWCGLGLDSTALIEIVFQNDPITAFECLADAKIVDQAVSDRILNTFYQRLGEESDDSDSISRAFGAVAADLRPRGAAVFAHLKDTLANTASATERNAAAIALSLTNLPEAAEILSLWYHVAPEIRMALCRMGDLGVPALEQLAKDDTIEAVNDLELIGTPLAAEALTGLLWHTSNKEIATEAAWGLAGLLTQANIEDALRHYQLSEEKALWERIDWVWKPFGEPPNSSLPVIAGRIAFLLNNAPLDTAPHQPRKLDPRLILPLCCIGQQEHLTNAFNQASSSVEVTEILATMYHIEKDFWGGSWPPDYISRALHRLRDDSEDVRTIVNIILTSPGMPERLRYLILNLPFQIQVRIFSEVYIVFKYSRASTPADWINLFARVNYNIETGWHYRTISAFALMASIFALVEIALLFFYERTWLHGLFALAVIPLTVGPRTLLWAGSSNYEIWGRRPGELLKFGLLGFVMAPYHVVTSVNYLLKPYVHWTIEEVIEILEILACGIWLPLVLFFTTPRLLSFLPWYAVVVVWVTLLGACALIARRGSRLYNEASNPLRGILDQQTTNE